MGVKLRLAIILLVGALLIGGGLLYLRLTAPPEVTGNSLLDLMQSERKKPAGPGQAAQTGGPGANCTDGGTCAVEGKPAPATPGAKPTAKADKTATASKPTGKQ